MKLELGLDVLRSYKRLPYSPWHALAEFVDNSTQSYFNHEEALDEAYEREGSPLEVSIVFDKEGEGLIRISDTAMGMDHDELTKALRVGLPPDNAEGRSRYGRRWRAGMPTSTRAASKGSTRTRTTRASRSLT